MQRGVAIGLHKTKHHVMTTFMSVPYFITPQYDVLWLFSTIAPCVRELLLHLSVTLSIIAGLSNITLLYY